MNIDIWIMDQKLHFKITLNDQENYLLPKFNPET